MQMKTKFSKQIGAKKIYTEIPLGKTPADLLHDLAVQQGKLALKHSESSPLAVVEETDALVTPANEPIILAENLAGVNVADIGVQGVGSKAAVSAAATPAAAAPHVLSVAIPAGTDIGMGYTISTGMGFLGWAGTIAGAGGVAAAAGGSKSSSTSSSPYIAPADAGLSVLVGTDTVISSSEASRTTTLTISGYNYISTVSVSGTSVSTGSSTTISATYSSSGSYTFDVSQFQAGTLTVSVYGYGSSYSYTTQTYTLTLDPYTIAPTGTVKVGTDAIIDSTEATATTSLTIAGYSYISSVSVSGTSNSTGLTTSVSASYYSTGVYRFDSTQFKDGTLTVSIYGYGTGNSYNYTTETYTLTLAATIVTVGGDQYVNATEATATTSLTVALAAGDTLSTVTVSGLSAGKTKTVTATVGTGGAATFDATGFDDGTLTVNYTSTKVTAGTGKLTLDTVLPTAPTSVTIYDSTGSNSSTTAVNKLNSTTASLLYLSSDSTATLTSVKVSGTNYSTSQPLTLTLSHPTTGTYANSTNYWVFDATLFADGTISVDTVTTDKAGNVKNASNSFTLDTTLVNSGGDHIVNSTENTVSSSLTVYAPTTADTISSVVISGKNSAGTTITRNAVAVSYYSYTTYSYTTVGTTSYTFDATAFADGTLSVTVNTQKNGAGTITAQTPVTLTKDTVAPGTPTVLSGTDTVVTLDEISATSALKVTAATGSTITGVTVQGTVPSYYTGTGYSTSKTLTATKNATTGNWEYDASSFSDGTLTVAVSSKTTSGGNTATANISLTLNSSAALVGGDSYINAAEAGTATPLTLLSATANDTFTSVSISGTRKTGTGAVSAVKDSAGNWTFDSSVFSDGALTATVKSTANTAGVTATLTLDTVLPTGTTSAPYFTYMNYSTPSVGYIGSSNVNVSTAGNAASAKTVLFAYITATGETIQSATVSGVDATTGLALTQTTGRNYGSTTNWRDFDATKFANGQLAFNVVYTDAAGNTLNKSNLLSMTTTGTAPTSHTAGYIAPVSTTSAAVKYTLDTQAQLIVLFPQVTSVANTSTAVVVAGLTNATGATSSPFTAVMNSTGGLDITPGTTAGYGSVNLVATDTNSNKVATDFQVAVTSATGTTGGMTTNLAGTAIAGSTVNTANALYDYSAGAAGQVFNISGTNTNTVMKGSTAADTFILNKATLDFAQINGGVNATANTGLDILQLTPTYSTIDLSKFNHAGQQVIQQIEVIDMATDTAANKVTLTAGDLFKMHSNQTDAVNTTTMALTITGGTNDTVSMMKDGFTLSGTANTFTATGASGTGYSKYINTYNDTSGAHLVEVLLQNGVIVA